MKCEFRSLKVEIPNFKVPFFQYSTTIRLGCPWCKIETAHKSRVYKSLKSLLFHISNEHKDPGNYYSFTVNDVKSLMQMIALSLEWGLLK